MEFEGKKDIDIQGFVSNGTEYDLDIQLPEDNREAIFGVVKDSYGDPISDAIVKLIEVKKDFGKTERKPVTHTFSDKHGHFVFGPLCPNRKYEIEIWANKVDHIKICKVCSHHGKCLKGINLDCDDCKDFNQSETELDFECPEKK